MKIGYPCINRTIDCKGSSTFRLKNYSEERMIDIIENNLDCLIEMLKFNVKNNLLFFRVTSDLVPFASHPICTFNWQKYFQGKFQKIGKFIQKNNIRISMHPDQFIVLNSKNKDVVRRSIAELKYHAEILDLMKLDKTAKIQLHLGGGYGDKKKSLKRFIENYDNLDDTIKNRLVIENDEKIYSFKDCLFISNEIDIPILFDAFHYSILNNGEEISDLLERQSKTWKKEDGIPMVDYSSQKPDFRTGSHAETIDLKDFESFLGLSKPYDFDIMLEIKDKENSALKARDMLEKDDRFVKRG
jgi:UV DNA damage endonuclease